MDVVGGRQVSPSASSPRGKTGTFCRLRQSPAGRSVFSQDRRPARGGLVGVGRPDDVETGDRPQRREVLDRLVGGAVLAQADRVVGPHVGDGQAHQGGQPHGGPHVVGERQERAAEDARAAVDGDAVHDRAHGVLADAEVQHPPGEGVPGEHLGRAVLGQERRRVVDRGVVRSRPGPPSRPTARASRAPSALITLPDATGWPRPWRRPRSPAAPSAQPSGSVRVCIRSNRARSAEGLVVQCRNASSHSACASLPRSTSRPGVLEHARSASRRCAPGRSRAPSWSRPPRAHRGRSRGPSRCSGRWAPARR